MMVSKDYDKVALNLVELIREKPSLEDEKFIFDFLHDHLSYLDLSFIYSLSKIFQDNPNREMSNLYLRLGNRISFFDAENKKSKIEISISCYELALTNYAKEDFPEDWAQVQLQLGRVYKVRIKGEKGNNQELSIQYYKNALEVYTQKDFPVTWAHIQNNLGDLYRYKIQDDKANNQELSIQYYKNALEVYTQKDFPLKWALNQSVLGSIYQYKIQGNQDDNLEISIQYCKNALEFFTQHKNEFPEVWAEVQVDLGDAYFDRINGKKSDNIENAIYLYNEALKVFNQQEYPLDWARVQSNLIHAYQSRFNGNKKDNIELSIHCCKLALEVYTQKDFPVDWATVQSNLGIAYCLRIKGEKQKNIEHSIDYSYAALEVFNKQDFPIDWARVQSNLGAVYWSRIKGDKSDNIERSIDHSHAALEVYNKQDFPIEWAKVNINLGAAYLYRIKDDKSDNIERSIYYSHAALEVYNKQDFPFDWATVQSNFGAAFLSRIKGDKSDNIERSIDHSHAALEVYTQQDFPIEWARVNINLSAAYLYRIKGDKSENIERSIYYSHAALEVYNKQDFPIEWAATKNNLAGSYLDYNKRDKSENIECSINHFNNALEIYNKQDFPIEWARSLSNLGAAYLYRIKGDKSGNIEYSINHLNNALEVYNKQDFLIDWANAFNSLGHAFLQRINGDPEDNLKSALQYLNAAFESVSPKSLPVECLRIAESLGDLYFGQGNWRQAINVYETAMQAAEISRSWSVNDNERQRILTSALNVYENAIRCSINLKKYAQAVEYSERIRSRQLVELMASKDLYSDSQVPIEIQTYLSEYQQLNQQITNLRLSDSQKLASTEIGRNIQDQRKTTEHINLAEDRKEVLYNKIRAQDPILAGQIKVAPISDNEIQQLIAPHTAILTFYTTHDDTHIFILKKDQEPSLFTCTGQGRYEFQKWLFDYWLVPYNQEDNSTWLAQIPEVLAEIATRLQLGQIITRYLSDIQELVIVPHLLLHQIPFVALPIPGLDKLLGEDFTIRFIPSCQILQYCQQRPSITNSVQGIVEDADGSLMGARYEGQKIAEIYQVSEENRLRGSTQATISNYRHLLGRVNRLHSSHHASSNLEDPLESALLLADGKITLGDLLLGERYQDLDEVFLSACETHVGIFSMTDDVATLTTGFLCIGARSVQSTLWSVNDLVTALFDIFYHQERREGFNRAAALQRAQVRLRYLSGKEFRQNYYPELKEFLDEYLENELDTIESRLEQLDQAKKTAAGDEREEILKEYAQLERRYISLEHLVPTLDNYCHQAYPFDSPYYWAGFVCHGMA